MNEWHDFFVAEAGASAALAGLIFVGISISLNDVIQFPHLLKRAAGALTLLMTVLGVSSLLLAPGQSSFMAGWVVLLLGAVSWIFTSFLVISAAIQAPKEYQRTAWGGAAILQIATIPIVIAGIAMIAQGESGIHWLVTGFIASFIVALSDAWVLLVETHR